MRLRRRTPHQVSLPDLIAYSDWHLVKSFLNAELGERSSMLAKFDRYHPQIATRRVREDLLGWVAESGLDVAHGGDSHTGIVVRARATAA